MVENKATESLAEPGRTWPSTLKRAPTWVALGVIFLAAAYLRLWGLEHSPAGGDQATLLNIALRWVTQQKFPLAANKSSVGLMNPPLLEYLLALPLFVRRDMVWVARFVALLNLASVALTYSILRVTLGLRTALLATLLYAVNPWAVYYSRLIWNPTPIPLFSTLLLGSLLAFSTGRQKRGWRLALIFLWLAAAIQLHLASLALIPAVALLFWFFRRHLRLKPLLLGALLFVLTFTPFIVYEWQTGFSDLADFRQATGGTVETNLASFAIGLTLAGEEGIWHTLGAAWAQWRAAAAWGEWLVAAVPWLLLTGLLVAGGRLLRRRAEFRARCLQPATAALVVVVTLWSVPLLFYVRHSAYLQTYYFLYLYPLTFILLALPADAALAPLAALSAGRRRWLRPLAWLPALLIVALAGRQFYVGQAGLRLLAENSSGERQLWHVQQVIDTLAELGKHHPACDLLIASDGYHAESSILGQVGEFLAPRPVRYVQLGGGAIVPRTCGLYVVASDDAAARAWYEKHTTPRPELTIPLAQRAWYVYELTPPARETLAEALSATPVLGRWENGVQLVDYALSGDPRPGETLRLALTWQVYDTPPKKRYHVFNHLLAGDGTLAAQADGPGVFSRYWQAGEFFVTWFDIAVPADAPPGPYRLLVGLYDWPSLERPLLDDGHDSLWLAPL